MFALDKVCSLKDVSIMLYDKHLRNLHRQPSRFNKVLECLEMLKRMKEICNPNYIYSRTKDVGLGCATFNYHRSEI